MDRIKKFISANERKGNTISAEEFTRMMPASYFAKTNEDELASHYQTLCKLRQYPQRKFSHKFGEEENIFHAFNPEQTAHTLIAMKAPLNVQISLYKVYASEKNNFSFIQQFKDTAKLHNTTIPDFSCVKNEFIDQLNGRVLRTVHMHYKREKEKSFILLSCINTSKISLINNCTETFKRHHIYPDVSEYWQTRIHEGPVRMYHHCTFEFDQSLTDELLFSIRKDLERYLHAYLKPMSVFDIVGPSMVGPSSSHTAGASKIGQIARNILVAYSRKKKIKGIEIRLLGSFRDTGIGHRTPVALAGGLCGIPEYSEKMMRAGDPEELKKSGISFGDYSASFLGFTKGTSDDDKLYQREHNSNIAEIVAVFDDENVVVTGFSIGGGNVEVRYFKGNRLVHPINGKEDCWLIDDKITENRADQIEAVCIPKISNNTAKPNDFILPFNSFDDLEYYLTKNNKNIYAAAMQSEKLLQGTTENEILMKLQDCWSLMRESIQKGISEKIKSPMKLSGEDAAKITSYIHKNPLFDNIYGNAAAYATAVNEVNARSGLIVACPTAGSCGVLPGVLKAYAESKKVNDEKIVEGLIVAGFLGMILFQDVSTAGADFGCQAEVGVGAAMAAGAIAFMEGGDHTAVIHAFTLTIKNCLGLTCDPVAGLVEVPCVKRNGLYTSIAISAACMALSGVRSFISPDEVVLTMREVGERLHSDYKETAGGGLAKTRDAKEVEREFEKESKRFFS
ncbi:MAG: L-serine ammonia-lyase, iron-sulfur-dependent, subunit alpha [Bacteroidota bacterium]